jgi:hypothetical protein
MSRLPFQKPLGWAQRFFFAVERGQLPSPNLSLAIDHDWPLEPTLSQTNGNTSAGGLTTLTIAPDSEHHCLVTHLAQVSPLTFFPATDEIMARLTSDTGLIFDLTLATGVATSYVPLIGCTLNTAAQFWRGIDPIYVPPDWTLEILHVSVAGGDDFESHAMRIERPRYLPLRLP